MGNAEFGRETFNNRLSMTNRERATVIGAQYDEMRRVDIASSRRFIADTSSRPTEQLRVSERTTTEMQNPRLSVGSNNNARVDFPTFEPEQVWVQDRFHPERSHYETRSYPSGKTKELEFPCCTQDQLETGAKVALFGTVVISGVLYITCCIRDVVKFFK